MCGVERREVLLFLPQPIHILSCQHSLPTPRTMMRPDISSISSTSVRQPGSLRTSLLQVVSAFLLMWQWETSLPMVMLPLSVTSTLLTDEGRPPFPELGTEKVPGVLRGAEAQVGMPTTGPRALPMVVQILAIISMLLI